MADMGNGRGFHIRAKGVKCGPHGLCPRAREKGFSGHHPPEADGAAGVLGRLGGQGEQEGVPREPDGIHPGMELRENILSYIVIGGLCADDGIKDGDGWVDASCCARIDDGFHSAAVNEDLGSDGRIDLADTTVQSGGRNAGDPSLVDREHGLPTDGAPVQKRQERRELVISGAQDSDFGEHVPSLLFAEQLRLWGYCNTQRLGAQSKIAQNNVVWYNIIVISI